MPPVKATAIPSSASGNNKRDLGLGSKRNEFETPQMPVKVSEKPAVPNNGIEDKVVKVTERTVQLSTDIRALKENGSVEELLKGIRKAMNCINANLSYATNMRVTIKENVKNVTQACMEACDSIELKHAQQASKVFDVIEKLTNDGTLFASPRQDTAPTTEGRPAKKMISYAEVAAKGSLVVIKSKPESGDFRKVQTELSKAAKEGEVIIDKITRNKKGDVFVKLNTTDSSRFREAVNKRDSFKAEKPKEKNFKMIIRNVVCDTTEEDFIKAIEDSGVCKNEVKDVKIFNTIKGAQHIIFMITRNGRLAFKKDAKVILGNMRYPVYDTTDVRQCWNCLDFNHTSKFCKEEVECKKCGEQGHLARKCTSSKTIAKCVACVKHGLEHDKWHSPTSNICGARKSQEKLANEENKKQITKLFSDLRKEFNQLRNG